LQEGFEQQCRLADIVSPFDCRLAVGVPAACNNQLVNSKARWVGDGHRDTALVQEHRPDRITDQQIEEAKRIGAGASERRHLCGLIKIVVCSAVPCQEFYPVAALV